MATWSTFGSASRPDPSPAGALQPSIPRVWRSGRHRTSEGAHANPRARSARLRDPRQRRRIVLARHVADVEEVAAGWHVRDRATALGHVLERHIAGRGWRLPIPVAHSDDAEV